MKVTGIYDWKVQDFDEQDPSYTTPDASLMHITSLIGKPEEKNKLFVGVGCKMACNVHI